MTKRRHALTNPQWVRLLPLLPPRRLDCPGAKPKNPRLMIDGALWIAHTGAPWRDLPDHFGPWQTVYDRFNRWRKDGIWTAILATLLEQEVHAEGIDAGLFCIDGSVIRAHKAAAGAVKKPSLSNPGEPADHALGRSQGGFGTKVHVVCDGRGQPLGLVLTPGQQHESTVFEAVMTTVEALPLPAKVAGDKAYRARRIRAWLSGRGIAAVIPTPTNEPQQKDFDRESYRRRNVVERLIGRLKEWRRVATRYEKLAVNFLTMIHLAMIVYYLGR